MFTSLCRVVTVTHTHCSPLVEFMIIKRWPFSLPREFTAILLVALYIPPKSNTTGVRHWMNSTITSVNSKQPVWALSSSWRGFQPRCPKKCVPKNCMDPLTFQHDGIMDINGWTLDIVYSTQCGIYKAILLPHLGASDHSIVMLMPVKATKPKNSKR